MKPDLKLLAYDTSDAGHPVLVLWQRTPADWRHAWRDLDRRVSFDLVAWATRNEGLVMVWFGDDLTAGATQLCFVTRAYDASGCAPWAPWRDADGAPNTGDDSLRFLGHDRAGNGFWVSLENRMDPKACALPFDAGMLVDTASRPNAAAASRPATRRAGAR